MKQIVLVLLLIGGGILGAQAQGKRGHGRNDCHPKKYRVHQGRWDDCNRDYRGAYYGCRPAPAPAQVVYVQPAQVVYVPAPPPPPRPRVVYQRSPKVVIATGPIVVGL
ncbi:hypothetical protein [Chitinophaga rhizophila]|uniref:PXPV repeat-containing protein n=1 Tax=Chitinophaga rhizophila TaxID=2866212 RepID=A0ABS7GJG4_9BACT|nr:hypothetical protein [Chitinophaga rhizophila]MBW8687847.1 hypothetical protein [Chitinophaga rhizophila]